MRAEPRCRGCDEELDPEEWNETYCAACWTLFGDDDLEEDPEEDDE